MGLLAHFADIARRLAGMMAAMLPSRWWPTLDFYVPTTSSALGAALVTFLAGAAIGIPGFLAYATEQASLHTDLMLEMAVRPDKSGDAVTTAMPVAINAFALLNFLVLTPAGWATSYLGATGLFRSAGAVLDDPRGDLILTILDALCVTGLRSRRERNARTRREELEGPEGPDRVVHGAAAGIPNADLVIVASRRKEGWDAGTVVLTEGATYRVGQILERTIAGRLRTLYPLTEHKDLEVFRRTVRYELPRREERDGESEKANPHHPT
jgi:hypothetical protein